MKKILLIVLCLSLLLTGCKNNTSEEILEEAIVDTIDDAMTYDDLYALASDKKIEIGMTPDEVKMLLGEPMSEIDTREDPNAFRDKGSLYGDEIILDYNGFNCVFYDVEDNDNFILSSI
ncbi:MAG: hypothetical protein MJ246_08970 [Clostridia bacterium]|nr:hypothetical protein [Clostridia bacterium]